MQIFVENEICYSNVLFNNYTFAKCHQEKANLRAAMLKTAKLRYPIAEADLMYRMTCRKISPFKTNLNLISNKLISLLFE